jgi:glucosylglycerate synthase
MAALELSEETRQQLERIGSADVVVGIAGAVSVEDLRTRAGKIAEELKASGSPLRFVFAWPAAAPEAAPENLESSAGAAFALLPFSPPAPGQGEFWSVVSAHQRAVLSMAAMLNARACIILGSDLAALEAHAIRLFAYAILDRQCGLAMPVYPAAKYEGLLNSGILCPLSRSLWGRRVRFPLTFDFAVSGAHCERLGQAAQANGGSGPPLLWPVTVLATQFPQVPVGQVHVNVRHEVATEGLELSAVLGQLAGSLFQDMDLCASHWQRIRGSQATPTWGTGSDEERDSQAIDPQPMLDSFLLGSRSLDEVWRLVLPPNTLLELRHLTRLPAEEFRMPDDLWASIVYDFALAWRLRSISRVHLLGALTPLYLGWVASWVRQVSTLTNAAAEQRLEQAARAWEEKKPYLLSRWRWPDRFNP